MHPGNKIEALLAELEAALAREAAWLAHRDPAPLLEALPAKAALLESLQGERRRLAPGDWEEAGYSARVRQFTRRQEEIARHLAICLETLRQELDQVTGAARRLRQWAPGGAAAPGCGQAQWA